MEASQKLLTFNLLLFGALALGSFGVPVTVNLEDLNLQIIPNNNSNNVTSDDDDRYNVTSDDHNNVTMVNSTTKPKITEGNLFKEIFTMGVGGLTNYAHEAKFIHDLEANGTNVEEYFKNITQQEKNMTQDQIRERHHHHHYYGGYGGYYGGGFGYRPSGTSMLLGGMIGYGLGRSRFGGGGGGGFGGGNYKTAMLMNSLPRIGQDVSRHNGYDRMKGNVGSNYGGTYGNSRGYQPSYGQPPSYGSWNQGGQTHGQSPAYGSWNQNQGQPPAYGSWNQNQGQPPSYSAANPHPGNKPPPAGWNVNSQPGGSGGMTNSGHNAGWVNPQHGTNTAVVKPAVVSKPVVKPPSSSGGGFNWPWSSGNSGSRGSSSGGSKSSGGRSSSRGGGGGRGRG